MEKYNKDELFKMPAIEVYKLVLSGKELKKFPSHFWSRPEAIKNAEECFKYLVEDVLSIDKVDIPKLVTKQLLVKYSLSGMVGIVFGGSICEMVRTFYPNEFQPWDFQRPPRNYWENKDNCIYAIKWLLETKLKLTEEEIKDQYCADLFYKNRITGALVKGFSSSPFKAIDAVYPGRFNEWDFTSTQKSFWLKKENRVRATKWLIKKLKFKDDDIKYKLTAELFAENGLRGMLKRYGGSPYAAINEAFPNRFKPWEFVITPVGFYRSEKNRLDALRWLIEEKCKLTDDEIRKKVNINLFKDNNLGGLLDIHYNGSPYLAINTLYPGKFKPWEMRHSSLGIWEEKSNRIEAIRWLVEEKLKLTDEELLSAALGKIFAENGLEGLLVSYYKGSPVKAIMDAYPGKFEYWSFNRVPVGFFNIKENRITATKWLIEIKLKYDKEQVLNKLSAEDFISNGLNDVLVKCRYSPYKAIEEAYPGEYDAKDFKRIQRPSR